MNGLRRKPLWLRLLTWLLWGNVLAMPMQAVALFGNHPTEVIAIWAKLTPQNQLVMALSALAAVGVQRVSCWGWYASLGFGAVALWNNQVVLRYPTPMPRWTVWAASGCIALGALWFLLPRTFRLFHTPALHWWRAAPRYRLNAPAELETEGGHRWRGVAFDISRTGVFVQIDDLAVRPGDVIRLKILLGKKVLRCSGRVVRQSDACDTYPAGIALRFIRVPLTDRFWLRLGLPEVPAT